MARRPNFNLFVSYSKKDEELVNRLREDLEKNEINVRYDINLVHAQEDWQDALIKGISEADGILVLITKNSMFSENVMKELGMARELIMKSEAPKLFLPVIYGDIKIPQIVQDIQVIFWRDNYHDVIDSITKAVYNFQENRNKLPDDKKIKGVKVTGGKAIEISQTSDKVNYWLLKLNPESWDIEKMKEGDPTFFSPLYSGAKRPEYNLYKEIRKGDVVLCFATGEYQSVVLEMEVKNPLGPDKNEGQVFRMRIKRIISPWIPLDNFRNLIPDILPRLLQNLQPPEKLFRINEDTYNSILRSGGESGKTKGHAYLPFYLTEGNHHDTLDQLDFENDITSFASVISLKKVEPPLAIGLFGNWGSGKSFFMEKLSERIEQFAGLKDPDFIGNVVHVKFNSWHYSDTNLWASLTTQIFESLNDYAKKKQYGEDAIKNIYKNLTITSYQLDETKKKLEANDVQAKILTEKKVNIEEIIKKKKETLNLWNAKDFIKIVFSDPFIQEDFQNIKNQFNEENLIENIDQINEKLSRIDSAAGQISESFILLKENRRGKWIWVWILAALFFIIGLLVLGPLKNTINEYLKSGIVISGLVVTWLSDLIVKLTPYLKKVDQFYRRLKSLKNSIEKEKEKVRLREHDEVDKLNKDINDLTALNAKIKLEQDQTEEKRQILLNELNDIGSGRLLASFLAGKSADDAYLKQLGIISWIRRDFLKLNELFHKQKLVQQIENMQTAEVQIDRIVLYIDDLDRCSEEVVVKVLEAIHLLLAFPLFVVVVGVDPRWLNNALSEKYKKLFGYKADLNNHNVESKNVLPESPDKDELAAVEAATSYDYLEKIFQIPFAIKPINKPGRNKLIRYLLRMEMKKDSDPTKSQSDILGSLVSDTQGYDSAASSSTSSPLDQANAPTNTSEGNQAKINRAKERLVFTDSELQYMQNISSLFGKTPRSINRYINIYRIIKAHGNLNAAEEFSKEEYQPIMFVLAVIVGYSYFAKDFLAEISKANDNQIFGTFINSNNNIDKQLVTQLTPFTSEINSIQMIFFKKNLELISRFSFRTLFIEL